MAPKFIRLAQVFQGEWTPSISGSATYVRYFPEGLLCQLLHRCTLVPETGTIRRNYGLIRKTAAYGFRPEQQKGLLCQTSRHNLPNQWFIAAVDELGLAVATNKAVIAAPEMSAVHHPDHDGIEPEY